MATLRQEPSTRKSQATPETAVDSLDPRPVAPRLFKQPQPTGDMYSLSDPFQIVACADNASEARRWILLAHETAHRRPLAGCTLQLEEAYCFRIG